MEINLPYQYEPRSYQVPLLRAMDNGMLRAVSLWHRRAGKDITLWNYMIKRAFETAGLYYYILPTYTQAKKIIWDGINNDGFKFIDYIPKDLIRKINGQEMKIEMKNEEGSTSIIQLVGSDRYDSLRGSNPRGCVFSEYAFQNPMAWEVVKPILKVNGGWAIFNSTPNGKNHLYDMFNMAQSSDSWFSEKLTIEDTGVLNEKDMQEERDEGMIEEMIQQEYYVSFDVGTLGNYYVKLLEQARAEDRVGKIHVENHLKVDVWMDLGRSDATSIGFFQFVSKEIRLIDSYEHTGEAVEHYIKVLNDKKYMYGTIYLPHDANHKRIEARYSVAQQFREAGFDVKIVQMSSIQNGIEQVRKIFPRLWIDEAKCKQGLRALEEYHKEYDVENKIFKDKPFHNWSSHFCDMIRYMAISNTGGEIKRKTRIKMKTSNPISKYKTTKFV